MARKSKKTKAADAVPMANPRLMAKPSKAAKVPAKSNGAAAAPEPEAVIARVAVELSEGTPSYYANFMEVGHTKLDFSLIATRLPIKPTSAKIADVQATGRLTLSADVSINFPPALIAGLIRALTVQKEAYEKETGTELKDTENESTGQGKKGRDRRR